MTWVETLDCLKHTLTAQPVVVVRLDAHSNDMVIAELTRVWDAWRDYPADYYFERRCDGTFAELPQPDSFDLACEHCRATMDNTDERFVDVENMNDCDCVPVSVDDRRGRTWRLRRIEPTTMRFRELVATYQID